MKFAICNETFERWEFNRICDYIASLGYLGLEIAPFTLAQNINDVSQSKRKELKKQSAAAGISIIALHWLLKNTDGYYLTSPDVEVQRRTGEYFGDLAIACADLGGNILVLGSPMQRNLLSDVTMAMANDFAAKTIGYALPTLEKTGVKLGLEPLGRAETNYLNTARDALSLMKLINHPNVKLHLDVKAMCDESTSIPKIIHENKLHMLHFHANDANRRGPGFGEVDFKPILNALNDVQYSGWISVEVFDYSPDPETIARDSLRYMKDCIPK